MGEIRWRYSTGVVGPTPGGARPGHAPLFSPMDTLKKAQLAGIRLLILLQAFCLIKGFPTKEDTSLRHAAFDTVLNLSTASKDPLHAIQYTDRSLLTTLDDITDTEREDPTIHSTNSDSTADHSTKSESPTLHSTKLSGKERHPKLSTYVPSSSSSSSSSTHSHRGDKGTLTGGSNIESETPTGSEHLSISPSEADVIKFSDHGMEYMDDEGEEEEDGDDTIPVEQRLMNSLMKHYERSVRPVKNASDTVLVRMGLTLTQIFDMDEKNQVLVTNVWLDQEWDDMFLTWNPDDYGGLQVLRLPCHKLWLPDIVLYNNAAEYTDGLMPANAMITNEGNVFWPVPTKLQSTCKVDVTYFPFDEQYCRLKFGSWTYDGFQVDMVNRTTEVDLSNYVENGEWSLVEISVQRNVVYYACCPEPFPDVTFIIYIRRRTLYYMYNVIFPCIMMSALTLLVFCLPPDSGEKITMGITVLLAFSVFMLTIAEDLPETSEFIPLLSIYLTIVMAMTSVSVIMTVFVLNLHHRGPNNKPVPVWLRRIFLRRRMTRGLIFTKNKPETARFVDEYLTDDQTNYVKNVSLRLTIENLAQELKEELDNCTADFPMSSESHEGPTPLAETYEGQYHEISQTEFQPRPPSLYNSRSQCSKTNEDILNALRKIIDRYERDDCEEEIVYEWRQVALAVDRILFWIFLFGTLASTIVVLIVAPITKWL